MTCRVGPGVAPDGALRAMDFKLHRASSLAFSHPLLAFFRRPPLCRKARNNGQQYEGFCWGRMAGRCWAGVDRRAAGATSQICTLPAGPDAA